jgi:hypothetical protein
MINRSTIKKYVVQLVMSHRPVQTSPTTIAVPRCSTNAVLCLADVHGAERVVVVARLSPINASHFTIRK